MVRDILRLDLTVISSQNIESSGENLYCVAVNSADLRVSLFT